MNRYKQMLEKLFDLLDDNRLELNDNVMVLREVKPREYFPNISSWYTAQWLDENFFECGPLKGATDKEMKVVMMFKSEFDIVKPTLEKMTAKELMRELKSGIESQIA